jgi:hypothetical protein
MVEIASDRPLFKDYYCGDGQNVKSLEGQYSGYKEVRKKSARLQMFFTEPATFEPCASQFQTLP